MMKYVSAGLGVVLLLALIWAGILYVENERLTAKIEQQAEELGVLRGANAKCAADVKTSNDRLHSAFTTVAEANARSDEAQSAAHQASMIIMQQAAELAQLKAPADPKDDCRAIEFMADQEIDRRRAK